MYMSSWDKLSLESYKAKCEKLEKENKKYIITFSSLYDNDRRYTKKIKEQEDSLDTMSGQLVELKNTVKIKQTKISKLEECLRKEDSEKEHLKSKVVDFTTVQNLQVQVEELKSCEKMRLLEEQSEPFYEVKSEFYLEIVHDIQDNSKKDLILSLQTQLKETAELVIRFSDEKYFALKEIESSKVKIKSLQTENKVLKSKETELNNLEKVYGVKESELLEKIKQMKS
ncbi:hypothetical protein Tco_0008276 [Tanacetum coccineum]